MCTLIVDTRESLIYKRHQNEFTGTATQVQQITVGDYAVVSPRGAIMATIERKSLTDLGASIKDGRYANKEKLVNLRAQTGCKIIFIIEGKPFPGPRATFANIEYRIIESAIFHMMLREDITVIWTRDTLHTAQSLCRFVASADSLLAAAPELDTGKGPAVELLVQRTPVADIDIVRSMWSCFRGISVTSADEFIKHFSIRDIFEKHFAGDRTFLADIRTSTGKKLSKIVISSLLNPTPAEERIVAKTPGISAHTAAQILTQARIHTIDDTARAIKVGKSQKALGSRADGLKKYLEFSLKPGTNT